MKPDISIGKQYEDLVCDECKVIITDMTSRLKLYQIINPKRIATIFSSAICDDCREKIKQRMVENAANHKNMPSV
jgi:hypothetical protein